MSTYDSAKEREELLVVIRSLREYLLEMNCSMFSAGEFARLILPYNHKYADIHKNWLLALKKRVDLGVSGRGGRHSPA